MNGLPNPAAGRELGVDQLRIRAELITDDLKPILDHRITKRANLSRDQHIRDEPVRRPVTMPVVAIDELANQRMSFVSAVARKLWSAVQE